MSLNTLLLIAVINLEQKQEMQFHCAIVITQNTLIFDLLKRMRNYNIKVSGFIVRNIVH